MESCGRYENISHKSLIYGFLRRYSQDIFWSILLAGRPLNCSDSISHCIKIFYGRKCFSRQHQLSNGHSTRRRISIRYHTQLAPNADSTDHFLSACGQDSDSRARRPCHVKPSYINGDDSFRRSSPGQFTAWRSSIDFTYARVRRSRCARQRVPCTPGNTSAWAAGVSSD